MHFFEISNNFTYTTYVDLLEGILTSPVQVSEFEKTNCLAFKTTLF
jgi:hypothetical protein